MSGSQAFNPAYEQAAQAFGKFVPGFDFLQALVQNAGKALPSVGQWVAPTLDPAELERRIEELRTVQFWLEQNARMLSVTIQALEVQRMTLGTLKGMNVSMTELSEALKVPVPDFAAPPAAAAPSSAPAPAPTAAPAPAAAADADPGTGAAPIDPGQWWGALTQQFTQLATQAMQASSQAAQDAAGQAQEVMQASAAAMEEATAAAAAAAAAVVPPAPAAAPRKAPAQRARATAAPAAAPKPAATPRRAPAKKAGAKKA